MEDSKSVVPSGAYGIPKWILKKGMRYEVDDFIVSPPSLDDGGFLRLRYGTSSPQEASLQGVGQDGGMTVEVKDDILQFSSDTPPTTTITIGPGGFSVQGSPTSTPLTTPETNGVTPGVHPLLVLPLKFGGASVAAKEVVQEDISRSWENIHAHTTTTTTTTTTSSLLDKVSNLAINPTDSAVTSPVTTPFTTPRTSPIFQRKGMRVAMDSQRKVSAHSYFCTKQHRDNLMNLSENYKEELAPPGQPVKKAEDVVIPPHTLDANIMGQRRRQAKPKPSTLREMNFWAPTSM